MSDAKRDAMLSKVRGLLAKADATNHPAEADTFREAAERLMSKYQIEAWQLASVEEKDKSIIAKDFDITFYYTDRSEAAPYKWWVFTEIARHCRVKVVTWKSTTIPPVGSEGKWSYWLPIVGTESDIAYFDMLFTTCLLELSRGLEPNPDPQKSFEENVATLKESGMQWLRIAELLWKAGMLDKDKYPDLPTQKQVHNMGLATVYTRFCERTNRPRLRTTPKIYQRSFAAGFEEEISRRLRVMRMTRTTEEGTVGITPVDEPNGGTALVLADIWDRVTLKAKELYGEPPQRTGKARKGKVRQVKFDLGGIAAGTRAADSVDLSGGKKVSTTPKEIDR